MRFRPIAFLNKIVAAIASIWTTTTAPVASTSDESSHTAVTFGNGVFVAISHNGFGFLSSPDGINWTKRELPLDCFDAAFQDIIFADGKFVAVCSTNGYTEQKDVVVVSTDGITWTSYLNVLGAATGSSWMGINHGNGLFVAVANLGINTCMVSSDGITWTAKAGAPASLGVAYGAGKWVFGSITTGVCYTTTDFITFTSRTSATRFIRRVRFLGGIFLAVCNTGGLSLRAARSSDGITWTSINLGTTVSPSDVTYNGSSMFVITHYQATFVSTSPDGITWTQRARPSNSYGISVTYGNSLYVSVDDYLSNRISTSPDGITWTQRPSNLYPTAKGHLSVAYGNSMWVAVSRTGTGNRISSSPDGITWTNRTVADNYWAAVTFGNGLFVALASTGTGNRVATSPDGITWTARTSIDKNYTGVIYANGLFVAVSATSATPVATSPDGITWTSRSANGLYNSVSFGNGVFVALGGSGTTTTYLATSPDGITWTDRTSPNTSAWASVAYGNGLFVAVAASGVSSMITSPDGITWTIRTCQAGLWKSIAFGNGKFISVSATTAGVNSKIQTSANGINWEYMENPVVRNNWAGIAYGGGKFVTVSNVGSIDKPIAYLLD